MPKRKKIKQSIGVSTPGSVINLVKKLRQAIQRVRNELGVETVEEAIRMTKNFHNKLVTLYKQRDPTTED